MLGHTGITLVINAFHCTAPVNILAAAFAHLLSRMTSSCMLCHQMTARLQCDNIGSKALYNRRPWIVHAVEAAGRCHSQNNGQLNDWLCEQSCRVASSYSLCQKEGPQTKRTFSQSMMMETVIIDLLPMCASKLVHIRSSIA